MTVGRPILEVVVGLMTVGCVVPYVRDTVRGRTKPQRMSWLTFTSLAAAATVAQYSDSGITPAVFLSAGATVGFATVALLSIRWGVGGAGIGDIAALVGLAVALMIWTQTDNATLIVVLVIAAEMPAISATIVKAARSPRSETRSTWLIDGLAGGLAIVAAPSWSFAVVVYPAYHAVSNLAVVVAIAVGARRMANPAASAP